MVMYCCVPLCSSNTSKSPKDVSFHVFPKDVNQKKEWIRKIRRDEGKHFTVRESTRVCSLHFTSSDFSIPQGQTLRRLIRGSVPSKFKWTKEKKERRKIVYHNLPVKVDKVTPPVKNHVRSHVEHSYSWEPSWKPSLNIQKSLDNSTLSVSTLSDTSPENNTRRSENQRLLQQITNEKPSDGSTLSGNPESDCFPKEVSQRSENQSLLQLINNEKLLDGSTLCVNSESDCSPEADTQGSNNQKLLKLRNSDTPLDSNTLTVNSESDSSPEEDTQRSKISNNEPFCLLRFIKQDKNIKYYTGFKSYQAFYAFYNFLTPDCPIQNDHSRQLPPIEELFLTLVRLRKALPQKVLADLYNISEAHVSKIFLAWVSFLSNRLVQLPIWPSKLMVQDTMPQCFKDCYPNTRVIVGCIELHIEQPSAGAGQERTFLGYQDPSTAKGVLGIAPNGQITFVSSLYDGPVSDETLITHCGLWEKLDKGDSVMVQKGFAIDEELKARDISLIIPAFVKNQDHFTKDELDQSSSIAKVGGHVEKAVRKIKEFHILSGVIPITLCPNLDKIWLCCAYLANFTE